MHAGTEKRRRPVRRELCAQLAGLAAALQEDAKRLDPRFVELAETLSRVHSGAESLTQGSRTLTETVRERFERVHFTGDDGCVSHALTELQQDLGAFQKQLGLLGDVTGGLRDLNRLGNAVQKIGLALHSSTCSFAVESARSAEGRDAFADFLINLRQLADRIDKLGNRIIDECDRGASEQSSVSGELQNGLRQLEQIAPDTIALVRTASERVQGTLDATHEALHRIEGHVSAINRHAEAGVYFLQSGDILRQKLEHVVEALVRPKPRTDGERVHGAGERLDDATLDRLLAVQIGQLEAVAAEADAAHRKLSDAFEGLGCETEALLREIRGFSGLDSASASLAPLAADIRRLQSLEHRAQELTSRSQASAARAAQIAEALTRYLDDVHEVNRDLHLHALNAIVKTAWLGTNGTTLGVLSTYVHELSRDSAGTVGDILVQLGKVNESAQRVKAASIVESSAASEAALETGLVCLEELLAALPEKARATDELAVAQAEALEEARFRLDVLPELSGRTAALVQELSRLRTTLSKAHRTRPAHAAAEHALTAAYTMESERQVHRSVVQQTSRRPSPGVSSLDTPPAILEAATAEPAPETSGLGDNVELF